MLNWDDYNESDKVQKPQKIQETQPVLAEEKVEAIEQNISEYSPVEAGDRAKQAQEAINKLDTRQGEEELEGFAGRVQVDDKAMINCRADLNQLLSLIHI